MSFNALLDRVLQREGVLSQQPADLGGATKYGITRATLEFSRGAKVSVDDVKALTVDEAKAIYTRLYITNTGIGTLPDGLVEQVLDFAINSGPGLAIGALQECLGVSVDHTIGPKTLAAAFVANAGDVNRKLAKWRVMMFARLVRRDASQLVFLSGWLKRALEFI